jgi:hypothetical protein
VAPITAVLIVSPSGKAPGQRIERESYDLGQCNY